MSLLARLLLLALVPLSTTACEMEAGVDTSEDLQDGWNDKNDPDRLAYIYSSKWDELNLPGLEKRKVHVDPWLGSYWPMRKDGYNARWQGPSKLSAMEKYDRVFNDWRPAMGFIEFKKLIKFARPGSAYSEAYYDELGPAATWAHEEGGNYKARLETEPSGTPLWGKGDDKWGGMKNWFGHCNAWAAAAMSVKEPLSGVHVNGIHFSIADIKALLAATYEDVGGILLGGRCHEKVIERDLYGRILDDKCRDTNAGAFHVVMLNRLGIQGMSFVVDINADQSVWNHPVRGYQIVRQKEVDESTALEYLGVPSTKGYPYNEDATRFVYVEMHMSYLEEGTATNVPLFDKLDRHTKIKKYKYLLELDDDSEILGGEWIGSTARPDFLWAPRRAEDVTDGFFNSTVIEKQFVDELHMHSLWEPGA